MKIFRVVAMLLGVIATFSCSARSRAAQIIEDINNPQSDKVIVAVHRGDWRNNPENSLPAIEDAIRLGADIVEIDLALTADSVLVVCHDNTLDRTTTGHGPVSDHTLAEIRQMRLRCGHANPTELVMPTLEEVLELCRDRIVINIDKGYRYYPLVQQLSERLGTTGQLLIKGTVPPADVKQKFDSYTTNMMFMPIIHPDSPTDFSLLEEYLLPGNLPPAVEVCWNQESEAVAEAMKRLADSGVRIWANTLWNSLCGGETDGLSDDRAYYSARPDLIYGKLLDKGVSMIQTDRPALLIDYLRSIGRHD